MNEAMKYKGCHIPRTDNSTQITHGMHMLEGTHKLSTQQLQSTESVHEVWVDYI